MKRFLFVSFDPKGLDMDWRMPVLLELISRGHSVKVALPSTYSFRWDGHNIKMMINNDIDIFYKDYFLNNPIAYKVFAYLFATAYIPKMVKLILRIYDKLKIKTYINILSSSISNMLAEYDIVVAGNYPGVSQNILERLFYSKAKEMQVLFVGTPLFTSSNWYQDEVFPFNRFYVSSREEKQEIEIKQLHPDVRFLGCPCFDPIYIRQLMNGCEEHITPPITTKYALLILVNDNNHFFKGLDHIADAKDAIDVLSNEGYHTIVKPHPRSYEYAVQGLKDIDSDTFAISSESIETLLTKIELVVSFTSSTLFKVMAQKVNIIHYMPKKYLDSSHLIFPPDHIMVKLYFSDYKSRILRLDKFCKRVDDLPQLKAAIKKSHKKSVRYKEFIESFDPEGSTQRIADDILLISKK